MSLSLTDLSDYLLTWVVTYGVSVIFLSLLIGAIGVPLPTTFLVMATGAFVRQEVLELPAVLALALCGAVLGDSLSYGLGRFARKHMLSRFGHTTAWQKAETTLNRRGGIAIYLTRWLLTPLAVLTNLVAGSGNYSFRKFFFSVTTGELTWLFLYGSLGYVFSSQWEVLSNLISDFSGVIVGIVILSLGIFFLFHFRRSTPPKNEEESETIMITTTVVE